ncbi:MAG: hypothetical protein GF329_04665 [Candidatus Lokiarchaeota archaeon]|nr:hypothetical protein [Candidatus Lokiarchaeota archaeon]
MNKIKNIIEKEQTENPYSLIVDRDDCKNFTAVTRNLEVGDVIEWLGKEYICIGSGDLVGKSDFNLQEIRARLLEKMNIAKVREVYQKILKTDKIPLSEEEGLWIGKITSIYRPEDSIIDEDLIIFYLQFEDKKNKKKVLLPAQFDHRNMKFIIGLDFDDPASLINREVYILGFYSENGTITGRAIIPIE